MKITVPEHPAPAVPVTATPDWNGRQGCAMPVAMWSGVQPKSEHAWVSLVNCTARPRTPRPTRRGAWC